MFSLFICAVLVCCFKPLPSFVRAAVFGIVIEISEALVELGSDSTSLQVWHGQFVLLLDKGLKYRGRVQSHDIWSCFRSEAASVFRPRS